MPGTLIGSTATAAAVNGMNTLGFYPHLIVGPSALWLAFQRQNQTKIHYESGTGSYKYSAMSWADFPASFPPVAGGAPVGINMTVKACDPSGMITTYAGNGVYGFLGGMAGSRPTRIWLIPEISLSIHREICILPTPLIIASERSRPTASFRQRWVLGVLRDHQETEVLLQRRS